ncbi:glycosyltransferase family protein [Nonlabens agnitus]|uniref:Glycosyl transferase family 1 n=1 Tax=Nonlabens agnitus TaxID=870484 RepID=A0A2S9WSZ9_9FLAO|nr:glycosyl transferase family 1 [Nonlabens agnitus]PRP66588.1 glycosyl transferase family 1 [Nonlabens agnitus]
MKHQLFIVAFYWPPAGGPGVQRWLKFVKYLPKDQFDITVIIPENPDYASTDNSLMDEIPKEVRIIKVPLNEPSRWIKKLFKGKTNKLQRGFIDKKPSLLERALLWIRGNYFIPDARVSWVKNVVDKLENDIAFLPDRQAGAKANSIITTGPPHSVHLIGQRLKQNAKFQNLQWIADFRDPWTTIGYHKSLRLTQKSAKKHQELERQVLNQADQLIVTSPSTKTEFDSKTSQPVTVITNGFDVEPNTVDQPSGKFTISHVGTLLADRNPLELWKLLSELCEEHADFKQDFELILAGNVSQEILDAIHNAGLGDHLKLEGYVDHDRAVALMKQSQLLLLIEIDAPETKAIIPGKTFEYISSRRPIIAIGPKGSDIKGIIESVQAGSYYTYEAIGLKQEILAAYKRYKNKELKGNTADVSRLHRKHLTQQLVKLLER